VDVDAFHAQFDRHPDDRIRLFSAVASPVDSGSVLYPGSYVDIAPSVFFDDVTYVDMDRRAERFFAEAAPVERLIARKRAAVGRPPLESAGVRFHRADYTGPLPLAGASVKLRVSLYAGFVSEHGSRYLATGGWLLANDSQGDASLATLDPTLDPAFSLVAAVTTRSEDYRVVSDDLDRYMVPRSGLPLTADELHRTNRGVAFTKRGFAYIVRRG